MKEMTLHKGNRALNRVCVCLCALLTCGLLACGAPQSHAAGIGVTVNGSPIHFDGMGPIQINGRVLVPVRGVLESLGADVGWKPESQTVVANNGRVDIELRIGDHSASVDGQAVDLDVPAQIIAGHTMVPLRFLGEALGAEVRWNGQARIVEIVTNRKDVHVRHHRSDHDSDHGNGNDDKHSDDKHSDDAGNAAQGADGKRP
jgi:hypothetical protein